MDLKAYWIGTVMQEYKVVQIVNNRLLKYDDQLENMPYVLEETNEQVISYATNYFKLSLDYLSYPGKSFAVAIIYAHLIKKHFKVDFYESLSDPELFCRNDKYFAPYSEATGIYQEVIKRINYSPEFEPNLNLYQVNKTVHYFNLEFGLVTNVSDLSLDSRIS